MSSEECKGYKCLNCRMRRVLKLPDWNHKIPSWEFHCDKYKKVIKFIGQEVRKLQEQYEEEFGDYDYSPYTQMWRM